MLLTGDLGLEGEEKLLAHEGLNKVDIWKVSHHGSKYSGGERFLEKIKPQLSLISVGRNSYGHPSEEILQRLNAVGSQVETTREGGALMIESDGKIFSLHTMR